MSGVYNASTNTSSKSDSDCAPDGTVNFYSLAKMMMVSTVKRRMRDAFFTNSALASVNLTPTVIVSFKAVAMAWSKSVQEMIR